MGALASRGNRPCLQVRNRISTLRWLTRVMRCSLTCLFPKEAPPSLSRLDEEEEGEELIPLLPSTRSAKEKKKKSILKAPAGNVSVGPPLGLHCVVAVALVVYRRPLQVKALDVYISVPFAVGAGEFGKSWWDDGCLNPARKRKR